MCQMSTRFSLPTEENFGINMHKDFVFLFFAAAKPVAEFGVTQLESMDESPFKRAPDLKQNGGLSATGKVKFAFSAKLKEILIRFIPFIGDIHPDYLFPISFVILITMTAIFCSIFITGYYEALDKQFLSPISGSKPSKYCQTISAVNTGDYLATESGLWEGNAAFQYAEAAYTASVTSWEGSYEQYVVLMNEIYSSLTHFGQLATRQDLAQNLVYWMSLVFVVPYSNAQRFFLNGTPLTVLNRQNTGGTVSNVFGDCNASSTASFDQSNGLLILIYVYEEFVNNPLCNGTVNPTQLGYTPGINSKYFTIRFDVRTLVTTLAININVTQLSDMVEIPGFNTNYTFEGVAYNTSSYYDPKYPGMAPLTCISAPATQCILAVGEVFALPVFNHAGASGVVPTVCDCDVLSAEDLSSRYSPCNLFSFLSGFIFWPDTLNGSPDPVFEMAIGYGYDYASINADAFNASFTASYWGTTSPERDDLNTAETRRNAYSFCNVSEYGPCSMVTFSSFDTNANNWAVSEFYYQVQNGACRDTFTTSYADWQKLIATPYAPLTQSYQQCTSSPRILLVTQAGITMGNVYLLLPFCAIFFVALFHLYKRGRGGLHERLYSEYEVGQALRALSVSLLLARDGRAGLVGDSKEGCSEYKRASNLTITDGSGHGGERGQRLEGLVERLAAELADYTEVVTHKEKQGITPLNAADTVKAPDNNDITSSSNPLNTKLISSDGLSSLEDGSSTVTPRPSS